MTTEAKRMGETIAEQIKMVMEKVHPDGSWTRSKVDTIPGFLIHCHACSRPTACIQGSPRCSACGTMYRDDAAVTNADVPYRPATVDQVRAYVEACLPDVLPAAVHAVVVVTDYRTLGTVNVDIGLNSEPPYPDDRALVREQAQTIATLQSTVEGLIDFDTRRRQIAWSLFRAEVQDELMQIMEPNPFVHNGVVMGMMLHGDYDHILLVMWTKTKLDVRARCEAKAEDIAMMMGEPPEVP